MIYVLGSTTVDMVAKVPYVPVSGETLRAEKEPIRRSRLQNWAAALSLSGKRATIPTAEL